MRAAVEGLRYGDGDIRKLRGRRGEFRLRVGDRRVIFQRNWQTRVLLVIAITLRKDVYRR